MDTKQPSISDLWSHLVGSRTGMGVKETQPVEKKRRPIGSNLTALVEDLIRMADLQLQLLKLDLQQFWANTGKSVVVVVMAGLFLLGAIPVLLLGLAGALQTASGLSLFASQLIVSFFAIILGGLLLRGALLTIGEATKSLKRSQEELTNNLTWMRDVLQQDD